MNLLNVLSVKISYPALQKIAPLKSHMFEITLFIPLRQASHAGYPKSMGIVGSRIIPSKKSDSNMVEVDCPLCTKTVDLGGDSKGTYECPYCNEDFDYEPEIFLTAPIIIGKKTNHSEVLNLLSEIFTYFVLTVLSAGVLSLMKFFEDRSYKKKRLEFQREYSNGILNPGFLSGSGIKVYPNLEAELLPIAKDTPSHKFRKEYITGLVFYHTHGAYVKVELHIISDGHFVATINVGWGANARRKGRGLAEQFCALYNLEMDETEARVYDSK